MKNLISFILLMFPLLVFGQTLAIETEEMNKAFMKDQQNQAVKDKVLEWQSFVKNNVYPELPYNKATKTISYQYIIDCKSMPTANIKNRVKEWIALNFGSYSAVLHFENDNKIIVKGSFDVYYEEKIMFFFFKTSFPIIVPVRCNYIFTFKDSFVKIDISNTESGTNYVSKSDQVTTKFATFNQFFPISKWDSKQWRYYLEVVSQSDLMWKTSFWNIEKYIMSEKEDYNFTK